MDRVCEDEPAAKVAANQSNGPRVIEMRGHDRGSLPSGAGFTLAMNFLPGF